MTTEGAGIRDGGTADLDSEDGGTSAVLESSGLRIVRVETEGGDVLHVTWPEDDPDPDPADVLASLGDPGEVKGPSVAVWGEDQALADRVPAPAEHPRGVRGPAEDFGADEVID